ncbi:unnamed protein product [Jaminaea pallidilutea]
MDDESSAVSQLGSLALGNLLQEIGVHSGEDGMDRLGIGGSGSKTSQSALGREQIYNEKYEDDDDDELNRMSGRGGAEDDRQAHDQQQSLQDRYFAKGLASMGTSKAAVRGETDDFDDDEDGEGEEDDDDDDDDEDEKPLPRRPAPPPPPAAVHLPFIKSEPIEQESLMESPQPAAAEPVTLPSLRLPTPPPPRDVREFWPDFDSNRILDFTDFFAAPRRKKRKAASGKAVRLPASARKPQVMPSTKELSLQADRRQRKVQPYIHGAAGNLLDEERRLAKERLGRTAFAAAELPSSALMMPELDDWETKVLARDFAALNPASVINRPFNRELVSDDWMESILWSRQQAKDPHKIALNSRLILDLNDEDMMIESVNPDEDKERAAAMLASNAPLLSRRAAAAAASLDPLNMSNDGYYELSREQRQRIQRQTLGALVVQHTKVARKLQLPFYKTRLNKVEARSFHRPAMQFPINIPLTFSRVERAGGGKKDRKRSKDSDDVLRSTRDLTLKEQGPFVLYEYSEEFPPIPSKIGMGSILVNYYRKKDSKDEHVPKLDLGEPFILEPNDESPFLKFGSVEPGQVQPTLYNNLVRAPLFRHQPATTDFLLVRVTTKNAVRYYLRDIKNIFVVGQNYPLQVIPGPHARLVTNAIRNRLIMVARRLVEQSKGERIKIHRIMKYFPDQSELQMRQRLKEFMEYARKAGDPNQGFWRLRSNVTLPNDEELAKLLPPEHICLAEAMQAGQRHLLDAGYTRTAEGNDEDEAGDNNKDVSTMDIEQLLAPWITSKNFIMATQGKAMLRLHGEGDPTGRGEAFSFVRVSMKDVFYKAGEDLETRLAQQAEEEKRSGHKYNVARQQQIYREEIQRIWDTQRKALSSAVPPELTPEEANPPPTPEPEEEEDEDAEGEEDDEFSAQVKAADMPNHVEPGKVLRIRRQMPNGRWTTEVVRDRKVIQSYIASRLRIADEDTVTDELKPTGDAALDAARRKRLEAELLSRKKNQERRLARHHAKAVAQGKALPGAYRKLMADKPTTSRRCGRCGQVGHMASNRSCPLWGQVPAQGAPGSVSSASASRPMGGIEGMPFGGTSGSGGNPSTYAPMGTPGGFPGSSGPATPATPGGGFFPPTMGGPGGGPPMGLGAGGHSRTPSFSGAAAAAGAMSPSSLGMPTSAASPPQPGTPSSQGGKLKLKLKSRQ